MATMIAWSDKYSVAIQEIDEQHQILIGLINKMYTTLASKAGHTTVMGVLDELTQYTRIHFAIEECLMRLSGYPDYDAHKAIHDRIVSRVQAFQAQYRNGEHHIGMELLYFLKDWLMDHIRREDQRYSPYVARSTGKRRWLGAFG